MKRSSGGYRALQFEQIAGVGTRDAGFADKHVYAVEGVPGLYRRVAKPTVSDYGSAGVVPAFFGDGTLYYLKLDVALETELKDAGVAFATFEHAAGAGGTWVKTEEPDDVARANARARELHANPPADLLTGTEGEEKPATRKRAAGSKITHSTAPLPPMTDEHGNPLPGSLADEEAKMRLRQEAAGQPVAVPPTPEVARAMSIHEQIAAQDGADAPVPPPEDAPAPATTPPPEVVPAGQVSASTGLAPTAGLDW